MKSNLPALIVFALFFVGSLFLTWTSFKNFKNQENNNLETLRNRSAELENQLQENLTNWQQKVRVKTPQNIKDSLESKEAAVAKGEPLWPCSPLKPLDEVNLWLDSQGKLDTHKLAKFEELQSHDPYLIRLWLENHSQNLLNVQSLENLLTLADQGERNQKEYLDFKDNVWVHTQEYNSKVIWRATTIPENILETADPHLDWQAQPSTDDVSQGILDETPIHWILTPAGQSFAKQPGNLRGLVISLVLTFAIFIYGIFFFVRSQMNLRQQVNLREQLVADISHELRTPVTTLRLYAEMLRDGRLADKKNQQEYFENLVRESKRLGRLIENILDFSRLNQGKLQVDSKTLSLGQLKDSLQETLEGLDTDNKISITFPQDEMIWADMEATIQVFYNLIVNALKYAPEKAIHITATAKREIITIQVQDEGQGIVDNEISHLFDPFFRGKEAHQSQIQGSGLGLGIAKALMEAMGGILEFVGNQPGACFQATFRRYPKENPPQGEES